MLVGVKTDFSCIFCLKGIAHWQIQICHHLLTHMSFKTRRNLYFGYLNLVRLVKQMIYVKKMFCSCLWRGAFSANFCYICSDSHMSGKFINNLLIYPTRIVRCQSDLISQTFCSVEVGQDKLRIVPYVKLSSSKRTEKSKVSKSM